MGRPSQCETHRERKKKVAAAERERKGAQRKERGSARRAVASACRMPLYATARLHSDGSQRTLAVPSESHAERQLSRCIDTCTLHSLHFTALLSSSTNRCHEWLSAADVRA